MYNRLTCIKTFNTFANSAPSGDFDIYKNLLWELFICAIVYMRHIKDYAAINVLLTYTYFLETNAFGGAIRQNNYTAFRYHSTIVEEVYKPGTEMQNKFTLMGDTICNQREKLPVYTSESIAEADLFLYQVCNAYDLADDGNRWHDTYWFPTCYVYAKKGQLEWEKMKSLRYCKKMQLLFIVDNIDELKDGSIRFENPFLSFASEDTICKQMIKAFPDIPKEEVRAAVKTGWQELARTRQAMYDKGEETLKWMEENGRHGIVLAGRPYHIDSEINHGIPELINSYGLAVLTEDSVSNRNLPERPLIVMDQWMYHSRLYAAANFVKTRDDLDLIQLNSFGCGLDAVTTDCVNDILSNSGKIYTCLKIDEVNNLGAARIRVRSLIAALRIRREQNLPREIVASNFDRVVFTEEMRKDYTILCPQMSPIHFNILESAFRAAGYNLVVMQNDDRQAVDMGLKYVNNDACYPSLIVVGQIMDSLLSGKYDLNKTAVLISQTGGGCRASNYIGFIRRALKKADMEQIPVISINLSGLEKNPGFKISYSLVMRGLYGAIFGDIFMRCLYRMRPYEKVKGSANAMHEKWEKVCKDFVSSKHPTMGQFKKLCRDIIHDFDNLPITDEKKPRVGIVGEILVKFLPAANNHLVDLLESEGAEAVMPDLIDFLLYCFYNTNFKAENLGMKKSSATIGNAGIALLEYFRKPAARAFAASKHFDPPAHIQDLAGYAKPIVSNGNQTGEGWFLTGEMLELIHSGVNNIVCTQPFGCLPNHVVGKGVIKELRHQYPMSNIVAIDYDPGASEVNQLNRIKLMLSTANKNLKK